METYYTVKQGDCLSSIAQQYSFLDYKTIYDHPKNALIKRKRPNPNILFAGDSIYIPDKQDKREERGTSQTHVFQISMPTVLLRLALKDDEEQPYAGKRYLLEVNKAIYRGVTNSQGLIEQKIPVGATEAALTLWLDEQDESDVLSTQLAIGSLDPVEEISGVQARLNNLGFFCGSVDGVMGPKTQQALKRFQSKAGIEPSGELDTRTRTKLRDQHETV